MVRIRKRVATVVVVCGAVLSAAGTASAFSIEHPVTGDCRQILVPGPATFPGNWEVVSNTPALGPGPWNGHMHADESNALGPVICPPS